jgi:undecaprenyl diphosphate synthase
MREIPQHIAIIMDGNGRWARERGLPRTEGHRKGIERIKEIVKEAKELGVEFLTLFCFSTENWNRPKEEIDMLMQSLYRFLKRQIKDLNKNNIRLIWSGREQPLPEYLVKEIKSAIELTKSNTGITLNLALNYGGRAEIVDTTKRISEMVSKRLIKLQDIDEKRFSDFLYNKLPDPDLLIRTSGEKRISNFLLWQISYTELYFTEKYWPDFTGEDLKSAIQEYQRRERRFGRIQSVK